MRSVVAAIAIPAHPCAIPPFPDVPEPRKLERMSLCQELVEGVRISFPAVSTIFRGDWGLEAPGSETASTDEVVDQNAGFGVVRCSACAFSAWFPVPFFVDKLNRTSPRVIRHFCTEAARHYTRGWRGGGGRADSIHCSFREPLSRTPGKP